MPISGCRSGAWIAGSERRVLFLEGEMGGVAMLPSLEEGATSFLSRLGDAMEAAGLRCDEVASVPLERLFEPPLQGPSDYWAELALSSIDAAPRTQRIVELLRALGKARGAT